MAKKVGNYERAYQMVWNQYLLLTSARALRPELQPEGQGDHQPVAVSRRSLCLAQGLRAVSTWRRL